MAYKLRNREQALQTVPKEVRNHLTGSGLPFHHTDLGGFLQIHSSPATGVLGEIARSAIKLYRIQPSPFRPLTQDLAIAQLHHRSSPRTEEGRKLNSTLRASLTKFVNPYASPKCKICDADFVPHHLEEEHHGILNKATPDMVKSLLDISSGVAHCTACDLAFPNYIAAFLHIAQQRHTITCSNCSLYHGYQETDTLSNMRHFLNHPLMCPEEGCLNGGLFGNISLLLYHIATAHPAHDTMVARYAIDRQSLGKLLKQFLTVPIEHSSTFQYSSFFRNTTEEKNYLDACSLHKHPISTMNDVLTHLHKKLSQMSVLRKKAFQTLQILNEVLSDNITSSAEYTVDEDDLICNATRAQDLQEEEHERRSAGDCSYVLLSCHSYTGLEGAEIRNFDRDDQEFTDRDITGAALTASGHIIPANRGTFFSLNEVIDRIVAAQYLLIEVFITFSKFFFTYFSLLMIVPAYHMF